MNPVVFTQIFASLGEKHRAFEYLDRAAAEHSVLMGGLNGWPQLAPLRSDPRFVVLVKQSGAPGSALRRVSPP